MPLVVKVDVQFPFGALDPGRARANFRTGLNNTVRGVLDRVANQLRAVTLYKKVAEDFRVEQDVSAEVASYRIVNDRPGYEYLLPGAPPHIIMARNGGLLRIPFGPSMQFNISQGGGISGPHRSGGDVVFTPIVHHPGVRPDAAVQEALDAAQERIYSSVEGTFQRFVETLGQEAV